MTIRTFLISFVVTIALLSCSGNADFRDGRLSPKTMQKVLLDINLAESYSITLKDSLHKAGIKNMDSLAVFYKDIFAHHKITQEQFTSSINWYKDHPDDLDTLYNNMIPIVAAWQAQPAKK